MTEGNDNGGTGSEIPIVVEQRRPDWVVIRPALSEFRKEVELERLPGLLDQTLTAWLADHPKVKVRSTLGVVEDGCTTAIHLWFDGH